MADKQLCRFTCAEHHAAYWTNAIGRIFKPNKTQKLINKSLGQTENILNY